MGEQADGKLGFWGAVSISVGGMIGGGVFAVLGVVATIAGAASWLAFTLASLVSMCAAYSYVKLNAIGERRGGSVSQLEEYVDNDDVAGIVGWTLLFGYVGAMAMYAYAFGSFAVALTPPFVLDAVPLGEQLVRPAYSVAAVGLFVALNLVGAQATGTTEVALVGIKVAVLLAFGALGVWYGATNAALTFGTSTIAEVSPVIMATAVSFVSFQGWQLIIYDQESIKNPEENVPKAIYYSIVATIVIDGLIAIIVTSLASREVIQAHPERALANAVNPILPGEIGFVIVAIAAIFSTGSAINGTLFSSAHFAKGMISDGLLPDETGRAGADGAPSRTILIFGALAAAFTAYGSLNGITSFGSLAFLAVFGAMSYLAFQQRDHESITPVIPAAGIGGTAVFFVLLLWHLWSAERGTFFVVVAVAAVVVAIELLYFERDSIVDGIDTIEDEVADGLD
ncbi:Amino acid transporter [Natronoarchaeum philippinense]|uniref:Amino acid transporter n=1 Tax=Natronoarchaeum philippinense TaxID=558529 RepID=A0A285P3S3_NATPI|nr:APC family permease [Natronoarchaeum philippinense]SNZ15907.1 Amino acid transporter [Natronoarchaeum philippinense]